MFTISITTPSSFRLTPTHGGKVRLEDLELDADDIADHDDFVPDLSSTAAQTLVEKIISDASSSVLDKILSYVCSNYEADLLDQIGKDTCIKHFNIEEHE